MGSHLAALLRSALALVLRVDGSTRRRRSSKTHCKSFAKKIVHRHPHPKSNSSRARGSQLFRTVFLHFLRGAELFFNCKIYMGKNQRQKKRRKFFFFYCKLQIWCMSVRNAECNNAQTTSDSIFKKKMSKCCFFFFFVWNYVFFTCFW